MFRTTARTLRLSARAARQPARRQLSTQSTPSSGGASSSSTSGPSHAKEKGKGAALLFAAAALAVGGGIYIASRPPSRPTPDLHPASSKDGKRLIPLSEVQKHNKPGDLWIVVNGRVLDLSNYAGQHPGGAAILQTWAGKDASALFNAIHSPGIVEERLLSQQPGAYIGDVDPATLPTPSHSAASGGGASKGGSGSGSGSGGVDDHEITLDEIIGLPDLDAAAEQRMSPKGWAYISAGATDMSSLAENRRAFNEIWFRPRVLVDVSDVDTSTSFLGSPSSVPFFIAPTGMSKLAGPEGEPGLATVAGKEGLIQFISTNSSAPLDAILAGRSKDDQVQFFQLYVDKNRENSERLLRRCNEHPGVRAVFVTVDCPAPGKREADERVRTTAVLESGTSGGVVQADKRGGGVGRTTGQYIDPTLSWSDLKWIRSQTPLPLGVKGVQSVEDAIRCADAGVDAIYLSNHGGRALDGSPPAIYTLLELQKLRPDVFDKCEVYIDGGVRRGTDIVKALCLGARGVGLGRPFLYALSFGQDGVHHAVDILKYEVETTMKLLGVTKLSELGPHLVNTRALEGKIASELQYGPSEKESKSKSKS